MTSDNSTSPPAGEASDPNKARNKILIELFVVSLLSLFCELMIIRWLSTEIRIFAYFKNLPLMAAFLGLGLGLIWDTHKRNYLSLSSLCLLYLSGLLIFALALKITFLSFVDPFKYMLFGTGLNTEYSIWTMLRSLAIMVGTFVLTTGAFVGFGQRIGQLFGQLKPLQAYSINVAGALAGTITFSVLCWLGTSPGVWLIVTGVLFFLLQRKIFNLSMVALGLAYIFFLSPFIARSVYGADYVKTVWSPYYRIDVTKAHPTDNPLKDLGYTLNVNYDNFQQILDCSDENLKNFSPEYQISLRRLFERPYHFHKEPPKKVLILGAGNGSDIAGALRSGVEQIDAVEIDPGIITIGKELHPEKPYDSPKVHLYNMDARTYLKTCTEKYDVILFAYVDSHAAFSSLSSLRMDNYLFTKESFEQAAKLLDSDGVICVSFLSFADWLWDKHCKSLALATGMTPLGYCQNNGNIDVGWIIAGPGAANMTPASLNVDMPPRAVNVNSATPVSTDDWPFLFLPKMEVPFVYMLPIISVLLVGLLAVGRYFKSSGKDILNWQMFGLGMGFMLLEVRSMANLSLLFGSTWLVNSVVISGVLIMILIANFVAAKLKASHLKFAAIGLILTLVGTTKIDVAELTVLGGNNAQIVGSILYLCPLIFAAVMFAVYFRDTKNASTALAFNLMGGLVGVCLEYLGMALGLQALGWIAVAIYLTVIFLPVLSKKKSDLGNHPAAPPHPPQTPET